MGREKLGVFEKAALVVDFGTNCEIKTHIEIFFAWLFHPIVPPLLNNNIFELNPVKCSVVHVLHSEATTMLMAYFDKQYRPKKLEENFVKQFVSDEVVVQFEYFIQLFESRMVVIFIQGITIISIC